MLCIAFRIRGFFVGELSRTLAESIPWNLVNVGKEYVGHCWCQCSNQFFLHSPFGVKLKSHMKQILHCVFPTLFSNRAFFKRDKEICRKARLSLQTPSTSRAEEFRKRKKIDSQEIYSVAQCLFSAQLAELIWLRNQKSFLSLFVCSFPLKDSLLSV